MADVESALDQLIRLGTLIRSSGSLARLRKADMNFSYEDYEHLDDENYEHSPKLDIDDLRALKTHLIGTLFLHQPQVVKDWQENSEAPVDFMDLFEKLEDIHRQRIEKLIFANLRRRNRFLYARRHAEKLASSKKSREPKDNVFAAEDVKEQDNTIDLAADADQVVTSEETLDPASEDSPPRGVISETTPSEGTVDRRALKRIEQSQKSMSRKSVSLKKSGWPHPPRIDENRASFQCPCCFQTLSRHESKQIPWR